jgi:magnesium transporter
MKTDFKVFEVSATKDDVGYWFNQYHMVSSPVVDENGKLVGVITIDDALEAVKEETDEDLKRLAGLGNEKLYDSFLGITFTRLPWLGVNLLTAILASLVISQFAEIIESLVALAVLMPIVASMGGNAGTQTLTVAVRALATRDLTSENFNRVVLREVSVGLMNGFILAIAVGILALIWYGSAALGFVLGAAMIFNMIVSGVAGIMVPVTLSKLKIDPAISSGVFVTTVTDIIGLFVFLYLAAVFLL